LRKSEYVANLQTMHYGSYLAYGSSEEKTCVIVTLMMLNDCDVVVGLPFLSPANTS